MTITYPKIAVSIITYNRPEQFKQVYESAKKYLIYPDLAWVLSDDGSPAPYIQDYAADIHLTHNRLGMGGNWNRAIEAGEGLADYVLCLQDDWLFTEPVDLRIAQQFLEQHPDYGMFRYHKVTNHEGLPLVIRDWVVDETFPRLSSGKYEYSPQIIPFLELIPNQSDVYSPYSGGIHLRHKRFTEFYGKYPEGKGFSESELSFMLRVNKAHRDKPEGYQRIGMLPHYIMSRFLDIGVSYRDTPTEKETLR